MRAGMLRQRITLQRAAATPGDQWGPGTSWSDYATSLAADVQAQAATEAPKDGQIQTRTTYTVRIRYRSDVSEQDRITWNGKTLAIVAVIDPGQRKRELVITAVETPANV